MNGYIKHTYSRMRIVHYNGQRFEVWYGLGGNPKPWVCTVEFISEWNGTHRTSFRKCG